MEKIHTEKYTVRNYQVGPHQAVHLRTILDYLQETADAHIKNLGISVRDLLDKGLLWVLAAYHLEVYRYPGAGDTITVNTWYPGRNERFYLRDFEVACADGEPVAAATTSWALIDASTRRPVEGNAALPDLPVVNKRAVVGGFENLPAVKARSGGEPFTVRSSCMDMYRHVNHVFYIQWALDSVSPGVESGLLPVSVEAVFKAEAVAGDRLYTLLEPGEEEGAWLHSIIREGDGREVTRLRTRWRSEGMTRATCRQSGN